MGLCGQRRRVTGHGLQSVGKQKARQVPGVAPRLLQGGGLGCIAGPQRDLVGRLAALARAGVDR